MPPECASSLRRLYQARLRSDYGDIAPTSRAEADQAVTDAEEIVALLRSGESRQLAPVNRVPEQVLPAALYTAASIGSRVVI